MEQEWAAYSFNYPLVLIKFEFFKKVTMNSIVAKKFFKLFVETFHSHFNENKNVFECAFKRVKYEIKSYSKKLHFRWCTDFD